MNEHEPKHDPELDLLIDQIDKAGQRNPYDAKRQARRLLQYFDGQQDEENIEKPEVTINTEE